MTGTGIVIGILAGLGVIAILVTVALVFVVRKLVSEMKRPGFPDKDPNVGFALFKEKAIDLLEDAPRGSKVSASFPIPSIDTIVRVSGKRVDQSSYQLEIRMGYRRLDHLEMIEGMLEKHSLGFERIDKGKGSIKILSEKRTDIAELLDICRSVKSTVMFDLDDKGISVTESIRKDSSS